MTSTTHRVDLHALSFDIPQMLADVRPWIEAESPTYDTAAVNRMMDLATRDFAMAGALVERIPGSQGLGDCVRARFPHPAAGQPGILMLAHLDTVHPVGTLAALPWRIEGDRCYGPGLLDMKGGAFIALHAMKALQRASVGTPLPVTVLLTCDEEIGSPSTRTLIEQEAARHKYVLVPEPARRDSGVTTGRYAIARYKLIATGRPSHAGARPGEGLSAIREIAHRIIAIEAMSKDESTLSCGVVRGGQWVNCVASSASFEILNMSKTEAALAETAAMLAALKPTDPRVKLHLETGVRRPLWSASGRDMELYEIAKSIAEELGFAIPPQSSPGGSDGNFTGALGIPTLDGLGPRGDGTHTLEEHIVVSSLPERGRLLAGLLARLS
jgi:glutamate carboxypeptidase